MEAPDKRIEQHRNGSSDVASDFKQAAGREHINWDDYFDRRRQKN